MPKLTIENIKKIYPGFSLSVEKLECENGEFMTILGPSGSGKTTLLRIIAGLVKQDEGRILVGGNDISSLEPEKRRMGMVFQEARLFPNMTLKENVSFGMKMQGVPQKIRTERSAKILKRIGMEGMDNKKPYQLSGGQQKRAAVARALLYRKDLLLMDEPLSELDPNLRREMRRFVKDMHEEYGFTAVLVTHDREEAFELSDRIAVMRNGEIVEESIKDKLYKRPKTIYTARFLGERNLFEYEAKQGGILVGEFLIQIKGEEEKGWVMIPERAVCFQKPESGIEGFLKIQAKVLKTDDLRTGQELVLDTGIGHIHASNYGFSDICPGQILTVFIDKNALHFLRKG
jgi:ABC-type Fe3+/spermidine/putrescine transport system ATPase subunit